MKGPGNLLYQSADAGLVVGQAHRRRRVPRLGSKLAYLFILPTFVFILLFSYYPAFSAVYHSFTNWDGSSAQWVGLQNYQGLLNDQEFTASLPNILALTVFWMLLAVTVPLIVARLIVGVKGARLQYVYRLCFVLPFVVPQVVTILLWKFILAGGQDGVLNQLLGAFHLAGLQQDWLGNPATALYGVMAVGFPYVDGFGLLIYTAGLQAIPQEIRESAAVDGARPLRIFFSIELPQIIGQIRLMWVLAIINGLQNFAQILILTQGGPGYSTMVPGVVMYQYAFGNQQLGQACSIGTAIFVVTLALTIVNLRLGRERAA